MSTCIRGRVVTIMLRARAGRTKGLPRRATVVCPAAWSKGTFLAYVRAEHPAETVVITTWASVGWEPTVWIVNPEGFSDYRRGVSA